MNLVPLFPGVPGGLELAVILLIAILLFGANKIPKLARSTGQAMGEFKKGREEIEQELEEIEEHADPTTEVDADADSTVQSGTSTDGGADRGRDRTAETDRES